MATTQYNDPIAYNINRRYDGIYTPAPTPGGGTSNTGNSHVAVPWRKHHRGVSNTFRRPVSGTTIVLPKVEPPKPEVTVSRAETKILPTTDKGEARQAITEFVADRAALQAEQPKLPDPPTSERMHVEPLSAEVAGAQASLRQAAAKKAYERRESDDREVLELISLLEGF